MIFYYIGCYFFESRTCYFLKRLILVNKVIIFMLRLDL